MNGFFKPLRRKIGVLTLALACVFITGWLRSKKFSESYVYASPPWLARFDSIHGTVKVDFVRFSDKERVVQRGSSWPPGYSRQSNDNGYVFLSIKMFNNLGAQGWTTNTLVDLGVVSFLHAVKGDERRIVFFLHYRHFGVPLTVISAWLLLRKPQATNIEPKSSPN